jgi:hypothetical protein
MELKNERSLYMMRFVNQAPLDVGDAIRSQHVVLIIATAPRPRILPTCITILAHSMRFHVDKSLESLTLEDMLYCNSSLEEAE